MSIVAARQRTIYLNGGWVSESEATVSVFDRGFLFSDAVYDVTGVVDGKLIDFTQHAERLERSLALLNIAVPVSAPDLLALHKEIAQRNRVTDGLIYVQVSRGAHDRNFVYPSDLTPTIVMFTQARDMLANPKWKTGITMRTAPDGRWANRHIKTVQLLVASMAKTEAVRDGFDDALLVQDGFVTEACSANFHLITPEGTLVTRGLSQSLLPGITRSSILEVAQRANIDVEERPISVEEALGASEAFITDSVGLVVPVVAIDRRQVGDGTPGPISGKLRTLYLADRLAKGISVFE